MSRAIWIEITNDAGEVEAVCTLAEFRAANDGVTDDEAREIEGTNLRAGQRVAFGGGAAPEVYVSRCSVERSTKLDEIAETCERLGAGAIEIQGEDPDAEESGAMPWSVWADGEIIGADTTLERTIDDAVREVRGWAEKDAAEKSADFWTAAATRSDS